MKYKAVIFDLDGTLLNTLDDLADSVNYVLENNMFPKRTIEEIKSFVGNGIYKLIERALPSESSTEIIQKCYEEFSVHYKENMTNKTRPYLGILELLDELKKNSIKVAIVTNKADFAAEKLCKDMFGDRIDVVVGGNKFRKNKPAPDNVLFAIDKLGVSKDDIVYIGDSEVDAQTAQNAGIDFIAVLWGFRTKEQLLPYKSIAFVNDKIELEKAILN